MRRLFIIACDKQLFVYETSGKITFLCKQFSWIDENIDQLNNFLAKSKVHVCTVLLDLPDEEFYLDAIPCVPSWRRTELINSRVLRYLNRSDLKTAYVDRARGKNKSQRLLISGIRQGSGVEKVIECIAKSRISLGGIYSVSTMMLKRLKIFKEKQSQNRLMISSHDGTQWRYSLFHCNFLLLSRCVSSNNGGQWKQIDLELRETIKFASSSSLLDEQENLDIYFDGPQAEENDFGQLIQEEFNFQRPIEIMDKTDLYHSIVECFTLSEFSKYNYGSTNDLASYKRLKHSHYLLFLAIIAFTFSIIFSISSYKAGHSDNVQSEQISRSNNALREVVRSLQSRIREESYPAETMKVFVQAFSALDSGSGFRQLLADLAKVITNSPQIILNGLKWIRSPIELDAEEGAKIQVREDALQSEESSLIGDIEYKLSDVSDQTVSLFYEKLEKMGFIVKPIVSEKQLNALSSGSLGLIQEQESSVKRHTFSMIHRKQYSQ